MDLEGPFPRGGMVGREACGRWIGHNSRGEKEVVCLSDCSSSRSLGRCSSTPSSSTNLEIATRYSISPGCHSDWGCLPRVQLGKKEEKQDREKTKNYRKEKVKGNKEEDERTRKIKYQGTERQGQHPQECKSQAGGPLCARSDRASLKRRSPYTRLPWQQHEKSLAAGEP